MSTSVVVLDFAHPLTGDQQQQLSELLGDAELDVRYCPVQFDMTVPLAPQVVAVVDSVGLTPVEWQTLPIAILAPGLASAAVVLIAEIHGRRGSFPALVVLGRTDDSAVSGWQVVDVVDVQAIRDSARACRRWAPEAKEEPQRGQT